ncbi:MAG: hypothetical protein KDI24_13595 [Pseudomonadales bacterium]|nr:hypothetical protein [Pseudomonadales bacterium]MCB1669377.1 hypothetical protein [Pseudomonadales bacterium]
MRLPNFNINKTTVAKIILITLLSFTVTGHTASTKDAFIGINEKTLKKEYRYLAVAPLEVAAALKIPDATRTSIESEIINQLEKEGFKILPPKVIQDIRDHMRQLVGLNDVTEENDVEKLAAVLDHSYRELLLQHNIDGVVALRIRTVGAPFANDKAEWHGTKQKIKHKGDGLMTFITGKNYSGTIAASSLQISIWDRRENPLYSWNGGIEVLMQRNGKNLEYMPENQFWQDEKRIKKAIKLALKPF